MYSYTPMGVVDHCIILLGLMCGPGKDTSDGFGFENVFREVEDGEIELRNLNLASEKRKLPGVLILPAR